MKVAVTGPRNLTKQEEVSVFFILDSIFCRYSTGVTTLVSGGRRGVEKIAEECAKKWNWTAIDKKESHFFSWWLNSHLATDGKLIKECDILISIQPRWYNSSSVHDRARKQKKQVFEFYI